MNKNKYPDLSDQMKKQKQEFKMEGEFENYDYVDDDEDDGNQQYNNQQNLNGNQQQNNHINVKQLDKDYFKNLFKYDPEMEGLQIEIVDQTSKTDWLIVEHVIYSIKSYQNGREQEFTIVQRRYSDFEWLQKEFDKKYIGIILPPLPEKSAISKINLQKLDLISRTDFFGDRLIGLKTFLRKVQEHPNLSKTKEFKSFIKDNDTEFNKFKENSQIVKSGQDKKGSGYMKMFYNSVSTSLSNAVGYISGTNSNKERMQTKDDDKFEKYEKYYKEQKEKISETTKCLHHIFEFKKKQSENMEQISTILDQLKNQNTIVELKDITSKASQHQKKNSQDLFKSIEGPLMEQIKHFDSCLGILNHRTELLKRIFENSQKIEQYKTQAGKQEEVQNLKYELIKDENRLETLQYLFIEDSEYFNKVVQNQIKEIIQAFSVQSIDHAQIKYNIFYEIDGKNMVELELTKFKKLCKESKNIQHIIKIKIK